MHRQRTATCAAGVRRRAPNAGRRGAVMELERYLMTAEMLAPGGGELIRTPVEVRFDPLTGHTTRILPERGLMPSGDFDLAAFARENQTHCPFCPGRIDELTALAAGDPRCRAHHARRGDPLSEPPRLRIAQLGVGLLAATALPAARRDHRATARRQPGDPGELRGRRHGRRPRRQLGLDQRQSHAASGQLALSPPPAGDRRRPSDDAPAAARRGSGRALRGLPRNRAERRRALPR